VNAFVSRRGLRLLILLIGLACGASKAQGQPAASGEYLVKAAFLYNFAKFVDWPPSAFKNDSAPLTLCILGRDPFGEALDSIRDKTVKGRPLSIRRISRVEDAGECHILFISPSEKGDLKQVLNALKNAAVLTVSEIEGFGNSGGMINFVMAEKKVQFEINPDAAHRGGLRISSQLLKLARIVTP
jgi:hypothetical protein